MPSFITNEKQFKIPKITMLFNTTPNKKVYKLPPLRLGPFTFLVHAIILAEQQA